MAPAPLVTHAFAKPPRHNLVHVWFPRMWTIGLLLGAPPDGDEHLWPVSYRPEDTTNPQIESLWKQSPQLFCLADYRPTVRKTGENLS
jgi:hypothetical protein